MSTTAKPPMVRVIPGEPTLVRAGRVAQVTKALRRADRRKPRKAA